MNPNCSKPVGHFTSNTDEAVTGAETEQKVADITFQLELSGEENQVYGFHQLSLPGIDVAWQSIFWVFFPARICSAGFHLLREAES